MRVSIPSCACGQTITQTRLQAQLVGLLEERWRSQTAQTTAAPLHRRGAAAVLASLIPRRRRVEVVTDAVCHNFVERRNLLYDKGFAVAHELHVPKQRRER